MNDPWWLVLIKVVVLFVVLLVWTIFNVWFERRLVGKTRLIDNVTISIP